jgi:hypothetical protein
MTTKLIELQIDISDSIQPPPTSEFIVNWLADKLSNLELNGIRMPPITEIKVTRTMPPLYDTKNYADKPQQEESFNTTIP